MHMLSGYIYCPRSIQYGINEWSSRAIPRDIDVKESEGTAVRLTVKDSSSHKRTIRKRKDYRLRVQE
jgi:hypothetical protein